MDWKTCLVCVVSCALILGVAGGLQAEPPKDRIDWTGRSDVTSADIISAFESPTPRAPRTRGIKRVQTQTSMPPAPLKTLALTVRFAFDSAEILPAASPILQGVGEALASPELTTYRFRIEGHTDSTGSAAYNVRLSQRRAKSVKRYLIEHFNIAPDRLITSGRGEVEPIANNRTRKGRQKNRRAEFVKLDDLS